MHALERRHTAAVVPFAHGRGGPRGHRLWVGASLSLRVGALRRRFGRCRRRCSAWAPPAPSGCRTAVMWRDRHATLEELQANMEELKEAVQSGDFEVFHAAFESYGFPDLGE